jgi:SAM-dependent methyltransferase
MARVGGVNLDVQLLGIRIVQTLRRDGLRATISKAFAHLGRSRAADDFDVKYGTDTCGHEPLWKFQISSPNLPFGTRYQATDEQELVDAINFLHENPQTFTFIDLGCGKGRTLLVASTLGFKHVIGVEFARELVEVARANLVKMKIANAVVMHADAADFHIPDGDTVLYLYNPFSQEVVQKVVTKLRESHSEKLYVIYKVPECAAVFDSSGFLSRFGCPPGRPYIQIWRVTG